MVCNYTLYSRDLFKEKELKFFSNLLARFILGKRRWLWNIRYAKGASDILYTLPILLHTHILYAACGTGTMCRLNKCGIATSKNNWY
jgi:hypothetical protein